MTVTPAGDMSGRRRIAIVGAGVSGLTAAHLLQARYDVTLFEATGRPGGHACTVDVPVPEGHHHVTDLPRRVAEQEVGHVTDVVVVLLVPKLRTTLW